ncbi:MAG: hypothetical protein V4507_12610 [Verrucomicrobiota bacterium]
MGTFFKRSAIFGILIFLVGEIYALDAPPSPDQLKKMSEEAVKQGKRIGVDYESLLIRALKNNPDALGALFRFTESDGFVGAGAEDHCSILLGLLQRWGDENFSNVLKKERPETREAVVQAIDYAFPYPGWTSREFPKTYFLGDHSKKSKEK